VESTQAAALVEPAPSLPESTGRTWPRQVRRFLTRHPLNMAGALLVTLAVLTAIFGDAMAPYPPLKPSYDSILAAPTLSHVLGTDQIGRDVLSRVLSGARISLEVAAVVLLIGVSLGTLLGLLAGYLGGLVDELIMRLTDVFLALPALVLAVAITATLGPSIPNTMIALGAVWWPWYTRLVRGQVLSIREMVFIEAARAIGVSLPRMLWRHILPETFAPIIVQMSLDVGYAILAVSSLSFIGLGAQPPAPEWGAMISDAQSYVRDGWWTATFPGLAIALTAMGFNLVGDGLRDFLDPRTTER
jgi:peptide/nickel transport system permease protein